MLFHILPKKTIDYRLRSKNKFFSVDWLLKYIL